MLAAGAVGADIPIGAAGAATAGSGALITGAPIVGAAGAAGPVITGAAGAAGPVIRGTVGAGVGAESGASGAFTASSAFMATVAVGGIIGELFSITLDVALGGAIGFGGAIGATPVEEGVAFNVTRTVSLRKGIADVFFIDSISSLINIMC